MTFFHFTTQYDILLKKQGEVMVTVDLDDEFLNLFFNITNNDVPKNVDLIRIKQQMINIIDVFRTLNANAKKPMLSKLDGNLPADTEEHNGPAILVIDDLGVITYQLKVLLSKYEYDVDCSQEIYDAVNKYKKKNYEYVIMDLFIPTEREGFILLTELRKLALNAETKTIIGVITASSRKEIEAQCKAKGADFFLEKSSDWQNSLLNIMDGYINTDNDEDKDF